MARKKSSKPRPQNQHLIRIVVSGETGTGKSTLAREISSMLSSMGFDVMNSDVDAGSGASPVTANDHAKCLGIVANMTEVEVDTQQMTPHRRGAGEPFTMQAMRSADVVLVKGQDGEWGYVKNRFGPHGAVSPIDLLRDMLDVHRSNLMDGAHPVGSHALRVLDAAWRVGGNDAVRRLLAEAFQDTDPLG